MARKLKRDVTELQERLTSGGAGQLSGLRLEDDCVHVVIEQGSKRHRVAIYYLDADSYPQSSCLASTEDTDLEAIFQMANEQHESNSKLSDVLTTICSLLSIDCPALAVQDDGAGTEEAEASDMDDDEVDDEIEDDDEAYDIAERDDAALTKRILLKLSRWSAVEETHAPAQKKEKDEGEEVDEQQEAEAAAAAMTHLTSEEKVAAKRQMFNDKEAFTMLSKELMDIMKGTADFMMADAIADDVYRWNVYITKVDRSSPLAKDLEQLEQRTGDGRIRLQLTFKRGLHPFFPAAMQVLSPRFKGPLAGALASHPMLTLANWDPWRTQKELVLNLKGFLEQWGHVDLDATLRSISAGAECAYSEIECCLARMEALTYAHPVCARDYQDMYSARDAGVDAARIEALKPSSKRPKTNAETNKPRAWASGTGYGGGYSRGSSEVWDARAAEAAQAAHDAELQGLASRLADRLAATLNTTAAGDGGGSGSAAEPICLDDDDAAAPPVQGAESAEDVVREVSESCLIPVLLMQLSTATFTDMCSRASFYEALLHVVQQLASHPAAATMFTQSHSISEGGPARSFYAVLSELRQQTDHFLRFFKPAAQAGGGSAAGPSSAATGAAAEAAAAAAEAAEREEATSLRLAGLIAGIADSMAAVAAGAQPEVRPSAIAPAAGSGSGRGGRQTRSRAAAATPAAAAQPSTQQLEQAYVQEMKKWQVETAAGLDNGHSFKKEASTEGVQPRPRMVRVGKELASLTASLPLNFSSSVFVRVDENNLCLWRAMITGPDDTPYGCGCFIFDIYFPPQYPASVPKVLLKTTGGGRVRFNPNLYNCGKVCLSLLGTWSGDRGESWNPQASSMLQVLVSIQSLILVDDPYFNEPGYESTMHSERGRQASEAYNANIMEQTMHYAMEEQLRAPPAEFRGAILEHFKLSKTKVVATCEKWISLVQKTEAGRARRMQSHLATIKTLLDSL